MAVPVVPDIKSASDEDLIATNIRLTQYRDETVEEIRTVQISINKELDARAHKRLPSYMHQEYEEVPTA